VIVQQINELKQVILIKKLKRNKMKEIEEFYVDLANSSIVIKDDVE